MRPVEPAPELVIPPQIRARSFDSCTLYTLLLAIWLVALFAGVLWSQL